MSNLTSSIDFIVHPTNGNFVICGQAKKMLQAILDTVLSPDPNRNDFERPDPAAALEIPMEDALNDQVWLSNNLDMDFWTSLEDHPLLSWPEMQQSQNP